MSSAKVDAAVVESAAAALAEAPRQPLAETLSGLPSEPGVYAFWAATETARDLLGLTDEAMAHPLYVGLAEVALEARVKQYVAVYPQRYVTLRWLVEDLLLVAGNALVGETALFRYLWFDDRGVNPYALPFAQRANPGISRWMHENIAVTTITCESTQAARDLEHPVIGRMLPTGNLRGMKGAHRAPGFLEGRLRADVLDGGLAAWGECQLVCHEISAADLASTSGDIYLRRDADGGLAGAVRQRGDDTDDGPLDLPFDLSDRRAAREAMDVAMDRWGGEPYTGGNELMDLMGPNYWMPGVISWALDTFFGAAYADQLMLIDA